MDKEKAKEKIQELVKEFLEYPKDKINKKSEDGDVVVIPGKVLGIGKIDKKITFIPGGGATQLSNLISFAITFSKEYLVLLDSDKESRDAFDDYKEQFGTEEAKKFFKYKTKSAEENVVFENHFSVEDSDKIKQVTGYEDIKSAVIALY